MPSDNDLTGCEAWRTRNNLDPPKFRADPDIAGVGVVAAFVASAALSLLVATFQLILDPPWKKRSPVNFIDRCVAHIFTRYLELDNDIFSWLLRGCSGDQKGLRKRCGIIAQRLLINISDQQLVTSLAMVIATLALQSTISVYHYSIVNDLLWFSVTVHTQAMISSRHWMRGNPRSRNWRFALMSAIPAFIIVSQVRSAREDWVEGYPYDLKCLLEDRPSRPAGAAPWWFSVNILFILFRYSVTYIKMFTTTENALVHRLYKQPRRWFESNSQAVKKFRGISGLIQAVKVSIFVISVGPLVSLGLFADSDCILLAQNLSWFGYGLSTVLSNRRIAVGHFQDDDESGLGFGQIVPLVLLATTPFTLGELIYDENRRLNHVKKLPGLSMPAAEGHSKSFNDYVESPQSPLHGHERYRMRPSRFGDPELLGRTFYDNKKRRRAMSV